MLRMWKDMQMLGFMTGFVIMDKEEKIVLDYTSDRMIIDRAFQVSLFSRIAELGKILEGLFGCPQDIGGAVKDGLIYVVQSRPQI
ncbi:putative alpha-glucan, water dikinase [Rosa chinensis]|uniref:Putative alpha-glucan, water dikinase n=1 Tax=Rosa chinensis TaxID=74649 RepID=A0A2P6PGA7_ROSCH|nr:putative alpha-glucan, water dikinase [Rosa chinensis]